MNPTHQLRLALLGLLATVLTTLTLMPVVAGKGWLAPVMLVILAVVTTGIGGRAAGLWWPLTAALQALVLLVGMTVLFAGETAIAGVIPTPDTLPALQDVLQSGVTLTRQSAPPVADAIGMRAMLALGCGVIALTVDLVAAGLRQPAVAGLPLLATYCVPAAVLQGGVVWWQFLPAAGGYLLLVASDVGDRVHGWGRVLRGEDQAHWWQRLAPGGRRIAVGALVAAVAVPLVVPGLDDQPITSGRGRGRGNGTGTITVINPIVDIRKMLGQRDDTPLLTYTTTATKPEPIRIAADEEFKGSFWGLVVGRVPRDQRVQDGLPSALGLSPDFATTPQRTTIKIGPLHETYLPLPYPATKVDIDTEWLYEWPSLNVVGDGVFTENANYVVSHLTVEPSPAQLRAAGPPPAQMSALSALPPDHPQEIDDTARKIGGAGSDYDKAMRLQQWLAVSGGFTYNEVPSGGYDAGNDSGQDAVVAFLQGKQGYCVQFASTMALMARSLHIPARVAVGFTPGTKQADGSYVVTARNAHAWPELFFQGVGWVRFEPTPASHGGVVTPSYATNTVQAKPNQPSKSASPSVSASSSAARVQPRRPEQDAAQSAAAARSWWQRVPLWVPVTLLVIALLLAVPRMLSLWLRRRRWRRAGRPTPATELAWDELAGQLGDLGLNWAWSWTPRAAHHRLLAEHRLTGEPADALTRLTGAVEQERYAGRPSGVTAAELQHDVTSVMTAVAAQLPRATRWRATWWPRSLRSLLWELGGRIAARSQRTVTPQPGAQTTRSVAEPELQVPQPELPELQVTERGGHSR